METFVIRVWMPTGDAHDADAARLRGLVEHVRLGERSFFERDDQLLAFLHRACTPEAAPTQPSDETASGADRLRDGAEPDRAAANGEGP